MLGWISCTDSTTPAYHTYRSRMLRVQCVGFVAAVLPYDTRLYGNNGKIAPLDLHSSTQHVTFRSLFLFVAMLGSQNDLIKELK